jgi:hypothetical protein
MNERIVSLHVLVLRQVDFGWHCEHDGRPLFLAKAQVALGVPMPTAGTRGTVQVREFAMRDLFPPGLPRGA